MNNYEDIKSEIIKNNSLILNDINNIKNKIIEDSNKLIKQIEYKVAYFIKEIAILEDGLNNVYNKIITHTNNNYIDDYLSICDIIKKINNKNYFSEEKYNLNNNHNNSITIQNYNNINTFKNIKYKNYSRDSLLNNRKDSFMSSNPLTKNYTSKSKLTINNFGIQKKLNELKNIYLKTDKSIEQKNIVFSNFYLKK